MKPVEPIDVKKDMKVKDLISAYSKLGFGAKKLALASEAYVNMIKDTDCKKFFGLAGAMVPCGMKGIIVDMLKKGYIDVLVTTGANLTHDLIEAVGHKHYQGSENADDNELKKKGIDRIYDVFMKSEVYQDLEKFISSVMKNCGKDNGNENISKPTDSKSVEMNIKEFLWELGKNIDSSDSILKVCYEKKIPIFCPAIADSGIGMMLWGEKMKSADFKIDAIDDLKEILDIAWTSKKCGVVYIGGGVPKNFIQQAMQFSNKEDGASYGIQITMDRAEFGGSSGAPLKEGISWGKMSSSGNFVDLKCDATIALPLIYSSVLDNI